MEALGAILSLAVVIGAFYLLARLFSFDDGLPRLGDAKEVEADLERSWSAYEGRRLPWGGLEIPDPLLDRNFLACGSMGSAKTVLLWQLFTRALGSAESRYPRHRGLVFDIKGDLYAKARKFFREESVVLFRPDDCRTASWDIATDSEPDGADTSAAAAIANVLVPGGKGKHEYFTPMARSMVKHVILGLHVEQGLSWDLLELVESATSMERVEELLDLTPEGRRAFANAFHNSGSDAYAGMVGTLEKELGLYLTVGKLWRRSRKRYALAEWAKELKVVIISMSESQRAAMQPIVQALLTRASELVLGRPEELPGDESWFFL